MSENFHPLKVQADDKNGFKLLSEPEIMAHRLEKRNDLVSSRLMRNRTEQSVEYDIDEHYMLDLQVGSQKTQNKNWNIHASMQLNILWFSI